MGLKPCGIMGSLVTTSGDWRSQRPLQKTHPNPSFLQGPVILRVVNVENIFQSHAVHMGNFAMNRYQFFWGFQGFSFDRGFKSDEVISFFCIPKVQGFILCPQNGA